MMKRYHFYNSAIQNLQNMSQNLSKSTSYKYLHAFKDFKVFLSGAADRRQSDVIKRFALQKNTVEDAGHSKT
jgi:hypothetical protein